MLKCPMSVPLKLNKGTYYYSKFIHNKILQAIVLLVGTYYSIIIIVKTQLDEI